MLSLLCTLASANWVSLAAFLCCLVLFSPVQPPSYIVFHCARAYGDILATSVLCLRLALSRSLRTRHRSGVSEARRARSLSLSLLMRRPSCLSLGESDSLRSVQLPVVRSIAVACRACVNRLGRLILYCLYAVWAWPQCRYNVCMIVRPQCL